MSPLDETPDFVAARDHVLGEVVSFARTLRRNGLSIPANAALSATEALCAVGLRDRDSVYAATHATLVTDARDSETFEAHFPEFWYRLRTGLEATATSDDVGDRSGSGAFYGAADAGDESAAASTGEAPGGGGGDGADDETVTERRLVDHDADTAEADGDRERSRASTYSAGGAGTDVDEDEAARRRPLDSDAVHQFERALATLSGRRWTGGGGRQVDARRALRSSVGTGGTVVSLPTRERTPTAFRTCVLVDVSRSVLDTVDRGFLLQFLDTLVADGRGVRVFFFDTDVREVTDVFTASRGNPVAALEDAEVAWGGGTRIGHALTELRTRWPDAVDRRTVTLVLSDGLDVGDVADLERGMTWLSRRSRAVLWLNPLAASAKYEPTCRGMAASLPYVDGLFALAGPEDLSEVARQVNRHGPHGPIGYEHDFRDRALGSS